MILRARLTKAFRSLINEAEGFLSMADPEVHGHTNIAVFKRQIEEAKAALAELEKPEPPAPYGCSPEEA